MKTTRALHWGLLLAALVIVGMGAGFPFKIPTPTIPTPSIPTPGNPTPSQPGELKPFVDLAKAFESYTPEQEYYLGRAVGAHILTTYRPYEDAAANRYVRLVGQALALVSDRPETFTGYHFQILDTDEVNAFAAPSGFIFVSRGLLRLCQSEDDLAAVLAHEIGHVQLSHALKAIKQSRTTSALTGAAGSMVQFQGDAYTVQMANVFRDSVGKAADQLIKGQYSQSQELEADKAAITILKRDGYDPNGLVRVLAAQDAGSRTAKTKTGFYKSHPDTPKRIKAVKSEFKLGDSTAQPASEPRQARYQTALAKI
jgi:predicted Zn-dependent protease